MRFVPSITFDSNGQRVRLQVCTICAATVVDDPRDDGALMQLHAQWHSAALDDHGTPAEGRKDALA